MRRRYETTSGSRWVSNDPQPPDAISDWQMVGAAAAGDHLYWFWMLEEVEPEPELEF